MTEQAMPQEFPDAMEEIVLSTPLEAKPVAAPATRPGRVVRQTSDGREVVQSVHGMVERLERENALESMARYLRAYRTDVLRLSQDDMAFVLDVGRVTIQRMESAHDGVAIGIWLRAMQVLQHLPVLANMDLARDRATLERLKRLAKAQREAYNEAVERDPDRFFG